MSSQFAVCPRLVLAPKQHPVENCGVNHGRFPRQGKPGPDQPRILFRRQSPAPATRVFATFSCPSHNFIAVAVASAPPPVQSSFRVPWTAEQNVAPNAVCLVFRAALSPIVSRRPSPCVNACLSRSSLACRKLSSWEMLNRIGTSGTLLEALFLASTGPRIQPQGGLGTLSPCTDWRARFIRSAGCMPFRASSLHSMSRCTDGFALRRSIRHASGASSAWKSVALRDSRPSSCSRRSAIAAKMITKILLK